MLAGEGDGAAHAVGDDPLDGAAALEQLVEGAHEPGQVAGVAVTLAVGRVIVGQRREALGGYMGHQRVELAGAAGPAVHQQPDRSLAEPIAHQRPFAGVHRLLHQPGRSVGFTTGSLRGQQQLAGGTPGVGGSQHVVQSGAEPQQQLARAETAGVEIDLAAHGHPVVFMCERSCFFIGF
ncbi:hypothetical protein D3C79_805740 [compost metagenome]